jgi:hypothetical protein
MANPPRPHKVDPGWKQSRVISMLQSPAGTTIAAMMKAAGWQQHSVRGFLAGFNSLRSNSLRNKTGYSDSGKSRPLGPSVANYLPNEDQPIERHLSRRRNRNCKIAEKVGHSTNQWRLTGLQLFAAQQLAAM